MSVRREVDAKQIRYNDINEDDKVSRRCGHVQNGNEFDSSTIGLARTTYSCDLTSSHAESSELPRTTVPDSQRIESFEHVAVNTTACAPSPPQSGKRQMRGRSSLTHLSDAFSKAMKPVRSGVNKALNGTAKLGATEPAEKSRRSKSKSSGANIASLDTDPFKSSRAEACGVLMQTLPAPLTAEYVQSTGLPEPSNVEFASQYVRSMPGPQPMSLVASSESSDQRDLFQRVVQLEAQLEEARHELLAAKTEVVDSAQTGISRVALEPVDAHRTQSTASRKRHSVDLNFSQSATDAIEALLSDLQSQSDTAIPAPLSINRKRKAEVIEHCSSEPESSADESFKPPVPLKDTRRRSPRIRADRFLTAQRRQGEVRPSKRPSFGHRTAIATGQDVMDLFKIPASGTSVLASYADPGRVSLSNSPNVGREINWPLMSDATKVRVLDPELEGKENFTSQAESRDNDTSVPRSPVPLRRQVMSVILENDEEAAHENATPQDQRNRSREPLKSTMRSPRTNVKGVSPRRSARCSGRRQLYGEVEGRRIWDEEIF